MDINEKIITWWERNGKELNHFFKANTLLCVVSFFAYCFFKNYILFIDFSILMFLEGMSILAWFIIGSTSLEKYYYKKKRQKIEGELYEWIDKEKFANVSELDKRLDIYNVKFPKEVKTTPERIAYFKKIIQTTIASKEELKNWYLFLEFEEDINFEKLFIPTIISFSGVYAVLSHIKNFCLY